MKPMTREWVEKAEADYAVALAVRRSRKKYTREICCFHLQQCVEKYLKGRLVEAGTKFPKTHDLETLLNLVLAVEPLWMTLRPTMIALKVHAVEVRYPGRSVTAAEAAALFVGTKRVREVARTALGL